MEKEELLMLLRQTYENKNANNVELLLDENSSMVEDDFFTDILCDLLEEDWHIKHEDIAFTLELIKNSKAVPALFRTALRKIKYLEYDNSLALARKCIWALWEIGTSEAIEKIKTLSMCNDEEVKQLALKQLSRIK